MTFFRRGVCALVVSLFGVGCAGAPHGSSVPPAAAGVPASSGVREPASAAAPSGTLYIAESHVVDAVPLDANGVTAPTRTITPHPNQDQYIQGLAVNADGTLDILEQFYAGGVESAASAYCRVVVESATANGSSPALATVLCDAQNATTTNGIAPNTFGGYDVMYFESAPPNHAVVRRFGSDGGAVVNSLVLNTQPTYLATDRGGHDYAASFDGTNSRIQMYKATTTDYLTTQWDATFLGAAFGPIAVSPGSDRTVYVVSGRTGAEYINALVPGATALSRSIGPFDTAIRALAVDSAGELYVGMNLNAGQGAAVVRVYDGASSGTPSPIRAIRLNHTVASLTGIAISE